MKNYLHEIDNHFDKRISFILASKNRPEFIMKTLEHMRKLKKENDELIVVEGFAKHTKIILDQFKDLIDKKICEADFSEGNAFNKGLLVACGKYIKLMTDDDVIHEQALEDAVKVLEAHPKVDLLLCGGVKIFKMEPQVKNLVVYLPPGINYGKSVEDVFRYKGCGIGLLFRHRLLAKVGILNANAYALDLDFIAQCISKGANVKFCRINLFEHYIELHSASASDRGKQKLIQDKVRIMKLYGIDQNMKKVTFSPSPDVSDYSWDKGFS